jgi:hypothetical protein
MARILHMQLLLQQARHAPHEGRQQLGQHRRHSCPVSHVAADVSQELTEQALELQPPTTLSASKVYSCKQHMIAAGAAASGLGSSEHTLRINTLAVNVHVCVRRELLSGAYWTVRVEREICKSLGTTQL